MEAWVTPASANSLSSLCSATGSGVVSEPYSLRPGATTPVVPIEAAA